MQSTNLTSGPGQSSSLVTLAKFMMHESAQPSPAEAMITSNARLGGMPPSRHRASKSLDAGIAGSNPLVAIEMAGDALKLAGSMIAQAGWQDVAPKEGDAVGVKLVQRQARLVVESTGCDAALRCSCC